MSAITNAGSSINLYMFHGGTNFGFINGAMHFNDYKSDVTSYGKYDSLGLVLPCPTLPLLAWALSGESLQTTSTFDVFGCKVPGEGGGCVRAVAFHL